MSFLDKILGRQTKTPIEKINIFDHNSLLTNEDIRNIRQIVQTYYHGPETETTVVKKIKKTTSLKSGCVSVKYDKNNNTLNIFYCPHPFKMENSRTTQRVVREFVKLRVHFSSQT